jgi:hypothetical protein
MHRGGFTAKVTFESGPKGSKGQLHRENSKELLRGLREPVPGIA